MTVEPEQEHPARPVWFYRRVGREYGPVDLNHLKQLAEGGRLDPRLDFIRHKDSKSWLTAAELDALYEHVKHARSQVRPEVVAREAWKKQQPIRVVEVKPAKIEQWLNPTLLSLLLLAVSFAIFLGFVPLQGEAARMGYTAAIYLLGLATVCFLISYGYMTRWVYHGWRVTNQYGSKVPAWLAALLLWVPGVNLFWNFIAFWWWSRDFNVILSSHPQYRYVHRPSEAWLMVYCIYPLMSPVVHGLLLLGVGFLASLLAAKWVVLAVLVGLVYVISIVVNSIVCLVIHYKTAKAMALAVDGIHDLNMRQ